MDIAEARRLYAREGPFVSVYLATPSDVEDALQRADLEWKNVRRELEGAGADAGTLAAVEGVVLEGHAGGDTLAVVASAGEVLLTERLPEPPRRSIGRWATLPALGPLFEWSQSFLPHIVLLADHEGADIVAFAGNDATIDTEVSGDTEHIHRGMPGGWAQRRFQQRAENTWEQNAGQVADTVTTLYEEIGAELVVAAGDAHALKLLQQKLPPRVEERLRIVDHGQRTLGVAMDDVADDVVKQVFTAVAERTVELLRKFREERGQHDRAAEGPARAFEALSRAQVETLLVHDDPDDDRSAWFGPEAVHAALERETLSDMGVQDPRPGRLVDVALRAAVGTGAEVRVVPEAASPEGGMGAILRHTGTAPGGSS